LVKVTGCRGGLQSVIGARVGARPPAVHRVWWRRTGRPDGVTWRGALRAPLRDDRGDRV